MRFKPPKNGNLNLQNFGSPEYAISTYCIAVRIEERIMLDNILNLIDAGLTKLKTRRYPNYYRKLSSKELEWSEDIANKIILENAAYYKPGFIRKAFYMIVFFLPFITIAIISLAPSMKIIENFAISHPNDAISWFRIDEVGVSSIFSMFVGILFMSCLGFTMMLMFPGLGHDAFKSKHSETQQLYWKNEIYDLIRKGELSIDRPYNTKLIQRSRLKRALKSFGILLILSIVITPILLSLDLKYNTIIYKNQISHSPYFSLQSRNYSTQDIVEVKRSCHIHIDPKNQRRPSTNLKYELIMKDGRKVLLFGRPMGASPEKQISALEHWHRKIPADKFAPLEFTPLLRKSVLGPKQDCRSMIIHNFNPGDYLDIIYVFDLLH